MMGDREHFFIKSGYLTRRAPEYFEDGLTDENNVVHQPDLYEFAASLALRFGCTHILDIGCGRGGKLVGLADRFQIVGVDFGTNIRYCRDHHTLGSWLERNLEQFQEDLLPPDILEKTFVICSDVIEHLENPNNLLQTVRQCLLHVPAAIISTPERDLVRGSSHMGPPDNPFHVREWNRTEFFEFLRDAAMAPAFLGLSLNNNRDRKKRTLLAVIHGATLPPLDVPVPKDFRVLAIMTAYNEEDIIAHSVSRLIASGVDVYVIDNWSTDGTKERIVPLIGKGVVGIERFPADGPSQTYDWRMLLQRVEAVAQVSDYDWIIHHDVDEIRISPWPGQTLRQAIYYVDKAGYNAVDHTLINFCPVDNNFVSGKDFGAHFHHWEFGRRPGCFLQIKAWKNNSLRVNLANSGGHEASFPGRRVFPYKFLLKHYPIRSQHHGEKKVLLDRKARFNLDERDAGWHNQYDQIAEGHAFLRMPDSLREFNSIDFDQEFLVERLTGIGIILHVEYGNTTREVLFARKIFGKLMTWLFQRGRRG